MPMKKRIYLTGFMGSGKSTVGPLLAHRLGFGFFDLDKIIEERESKSISTIFAENGEEYFREVETTLISDFTQRENFVLALGGGALTNGNNLKRLLESGILIYLYLTPEEIYERIKYSEERPLLKNKSSKEDFLLFINDLLNKRAKYYEAAQITIKAGEQAPQQITNSIISELEKFNEKN